MNRMRTWSLGAAGLAVLILVAGWFLLVSPTKAKVSDLNAQTAQQQATNATLETAINQLKIQNKDLPKQEAKLAQIRQHLPANPELPAFIRTLTTIAHDSGVKLVSVSPTPPTAVVIAAPVVAAPSPSASASPSANAATEDTPVRPAAPAAQASGLKMIAVSINVSGGYFNVVSFLTKVENLQRSMLVYAANVAPDTSAAAASSAPGSKVTVSINTRIFYSPPVAVTAPVPGTAPATGTATGTTPAATTPSTAS